MNTFREVHLLHLLYRVTHGVYSHHKGDLSQVKADDQIEADLDFLYPDVTGKRTLFVKHKFTLLVVLNAKHNAY